MPERKKRKRHRDERYVYPDYESVPEGPRALFTREELVQIKCIPPPALPKKKKRKRDQTAKKCPVCGVLFKCGKQSPTQWAKQVCCSRKCASTLRSWMHGHRFDDTLEFLNSIGYRVCVMRYKQESRGDKHIDAD